MARVWQYENDEEGLAGEPCEQWIVRDLSTDHADIIAVVPKTGDEDYDSEFTWPTAQLIAAAPELLEELSDIVDHVVSNDRGCFEIAPSHIRAARAAIAKAKGKTI
jgi:hypothetical protein